MVGVKLELWLERIDGVDAFAQTLEISFVGRANDLLNEIDYHPARSFLCGVAAAVLGPLAWLRCAIALQPFVYAQKDGDLQRLV